MDLLNVIIVIWHWQCTKN